jgi:ribosome modulation factor
MNDHHTEEAKRGYEDYQRGKQFSECPYTGFRPEEINKRWNWQVGWLHAKRESEKIT